MRLECYWENDIAMTRCKQFFVLIGCGWGSEVMALSLIINAGVHTAGLKYCVRTKPRLS